MADLWIREDWIKPPEREGQPPLLVGGRCNQCGRSFFPYRPACSACRCDGCTERVDLGPRAELETFAIMRVGPPDIPTPYAMGYVRTREGALIFTQITGCELEEEALELGQEMELVLEKIKEDEQGNNLLGWKFRPAAGGSR